MPTKQDIDAFLAVAQCGSISTAAEQLYVTQPALSRRIGNLEQELSCKLFERGKGVRGVSLTTQGKVFLSIAQKWETVFREAQALHTLDSRPVLKLAAIGSVSAFLLPGILREVTADDAPYRLDFHLCHTAEGYSLVEENLADIAFIDYVYGTQKYATASALALPVYSVPFVVVGGESWKGTQKVSVADLDPCREIRLPWSSSFNIWHDQHFSSGSLFVASLDNASVIKDVIRDDLFAFVPRTEGVRLSSASENMVMLELDGNPPEEIICCLIAANNIDKPHIKHFIDIVKAHVTASPYVQCLL
ncbi:MAG: LysR family transcriptional regulator [Coriobacteriales bacterium]|nr:LysR family transcriptional regulator [Coriobacteriales bacterium]